MKTRIGAGVGALFAAGCATGAFVSGDLVGGQQGDLRVLVTDRCIAGENRDVGAIPTIAQFGEELLSTLGSSAFKAFGTYLKEVGSDHVTRSTGANGGMFYSAPDDKKQVSISPRMRCVYLVRHGFEPDAAYGSGASGGPVYAATAPASLKKLWTELKLSRTPDLFVALFLQASGEGEPLEAVVLPFDLPPSETDLGQPFSTKAESSIAPPKQAATARPSGSDSAFRTLDSSEAEDGDPAQADQAKSGQAAAGRTQSTAGPSYKGGMRPEPPFFRLVLDTVYLSEFQDDRGTSDIRDMAIVVNYGVAASQATIRSGGRDAGTTSLVGRFAVGGIRMPGIKPGYYDRSGLTGLQTAWMPMPPTFVFDQRSTVDLTVDIIEFSPGNEVLADIGTYLAGDATATSVKNIITAELDLDGSDAVASAADAKTKQTTASNARFDAISAETTLIRTLQDQRVELEALLRATGDDFDRMSALKAARALEDQVIAIERQRAVDWVTTDKLIEVDKARSVLGDPRLAQ